MATEIEIGIYTHRWSSLQVRAIESIAQHTHNEQYSILVTQQPGNCHENMNRVWKRFSAPYVVLMDEDVTILQDNWLQPLIASLDADPRLGVVGCKETNDPKAPVPSVGSGPFHLQPLTWVPACVMAFRRERVPFLHFDENIPGIMGMTDVDACLQIQDHGLGVTRVHDTIVYHPRRDADQVRLEENRPTLAMCASWYPEQVAYMQKKWHGRFNFAEIPKP